MTDGLDENHEIEIGETLVNDPAPLPVEEVPTESPAAEPVAESAALGVEDKAETLEETPNADAAVELITFNPPIAEMAEATAEIAMKLDEVLRGVHYGDLSKRK